MSGPVLDSHRERGASLVSALLLVAVMAIVRSNPDRPMMRPSS